MRLSNINTLLLKLYYASYRITELNNHAASHYIYVIEWMVLSLWIPAYCEMFIIETDLFCHMCVY